MGKSPSKEIPTTGQKRVTLNNKTPMTRHREQRGGTGGGLSKGPEIKGQGQGPRQGWLGAQARSQAWIGELSVRARTGPGRKAGWGR